MKWNNIEEKVPEMKRQVMYWHDMTGGAHIGYYFGRDEEYPCENNHIFGSNAGFLTGDATHWLYVPEDPIDDEYLKERRQEWIDESYAEIDKQIEKIKQPIKIDYGKVGLDTFTEVNPKTIKQKVLYILRRINKPLHYQEMATKVMEWFPEKPVKVNTVHNELVKNSNHL